MSRQSLRATALKHHHDDSLRLAASHEHALREFYLVHQCISNNNGLQSLLNAKFNAESVTDDEVSFLKSNHISRGFDTTTLTLRSPPPTPPPQHNDASIYFPKPTSGSAESSQHVQQSSTTRESSLGEHAVPNPNLDVSSDSRNATTEPELTKGLAPTETKLMRNQSVPRANSGEPKSPSVAPIQVAQPMPDEQANFSESTQRLLDSQVPSKPAKTVHLPPEDVQEHRFREREADEERRKLSEAESKSSHQLHAPQTDVASSPSSTVDAHSAATPQAPQDSPDTSPDSETAPIDVPPPSDLQPTPEQLREKEEHDRILEAQKEIARKQALGDVDSGPDEQLRWEAREAAAREAEERAAREDIGGPEPNVRTSRDSTEAEQAAEEMDVDPKTNESATTEAVARAGEKQNLSNTLGDGDALNAPTSSVTQPSLQESGHPEVRPETSEATTSSTSRPDRMRTRVSSGALKQKSVSEILGHSQSPSAGTSLTSRKDVMSPEPISPLTQRQSKESALTIDSHTQHRPLEMRTSNPTFSALDQLDILKGAAEDPDKDYLEPLFRIQAHETTNSGSKTLPELIKVCTKALSTEDHFTSLHERLDFRMLRRIYQLQNANKWSLRQMEKCKEPSQPLSHHDHMMNEMKWMRKDFKAERSMKKSVCAWLAQRCADWVAADAVERSRMQVRVKAKRSEHLDTVDETVPDLEHAGDSAPEDDSTPLTPRAGSPLHSTIVVAPELSGAVEELRKAGRFEKALVALPKTGLLDREMKHDRQSVTLVSKFVEGKVMPKSPGPTRKRSRYEYEDEAEFVESHQGSKRRRDEDPLPAEEQECALFDPENKGIRERLHSNNAFRPPSEFIMPSTHFYEHRSGSQWIWEDDQKLRKLAKEYFFNWSLIADELSLPTRYKSSAERRTPWECFERWVELDGLPADMRKTLYFKTWFQRLDQSQQASERRYQLTVSALQQQAAQTGNQAHIPIRRRTVPTRVEKRRSTRYLWMVDGFRKLAKKREQAAWKQAESARAAAQRKTQSEANQVKTVKMTPQEFSKKRQERDQQVAEQQRVMRANMLEAQRQRLIARTNQMQQQQQQQAQANGLSAQQQQQQQMPNAQAQAVHQQMNANGQSTALGPGQQQLRPSVQMAPQRNGHLAPPQVNAQGIPQAQMRSAVPPNMQVQNTGQVGNGQTAHFPVQGASVQSPGSNMTTQQFLAQNQALLQAAYQQQRQGNGGQTPNMNQQMASSPNMAPPPTPQNIPQQLSSGHVPQIIAIQNQIRAANPGVSEEQLKAMATQAMKMQSQSSNQARQNAINAAAGISPQQNHPGMQYNQASFQRSNHQLGMNGMYNMNADANHQQTSQTGNTDNANNSNIGSPQSHYAQKMWQRQHQMMHNQNSPNMSQAQLNGSPSMAAGSPSMQYSNMGQMGTPVANMNGQRPPSRSATPHVRLGSAGNAMGNGMQSPGAMQQASPVPANMAR